MLATRLKHLARRCCPPLLWDGLRRLGRRVRGGKVRVVRTLAELDHEIARADAAAAESDDAMRAHLAGFRFDPGVRLPADPDSAEYRQAQLGLYRLVSGRTSYDAAVSEHTDVNPAAQAERPFPYATGSPTTVGEHLMAAGLLIRTMALPPGGRVLEFGPGHGTTTLQFAQCGYAVTAVDINPLFLEVIRARAARLGVEVDLAAADMLTYRSAALFDRVVFYECFHHCAEPEGMVRRLRELVAPGGAAVFAGEPITDDFPHPWGLRLDGVSAWAVRKFGWLELGFRTDYFRRLLARYGWAVVRHGSQDVPWLSVFVARRG